MSVETGRASATEAEIAALNADLAVRMRDRVPAARIAPQPARTRKRRPLGLAPAGDDAPAAEARRPASDGRFADPAIGLIVEANELTLGLMEKMRAHFAGKIAGLENTIGGLKNENTALRLILENLRITQRGERGIDGDRGAPGRDGRDGVGLAGPPGPRGERGLPAPRLATWDVDPARFTVTPIFGDGTSGAVLNLLGLFQSYDSAVSDIEDRDLASAAAESRAQTDAEVEAARWAAR